MIDAFDTADFNPELILSSVFLDPGLDFVTNIDDLSDNSIAADLLQQLGNSIFYPETSIATNISNGGIAGLTETIPQQQHAQHQQQQHHNHQHQQQQQQQQVLLQPSLVSTKGRDTIEVSDAQNNAYPFLK